MMANVLTKVVIMNTFLIYLIESALIVKARIVLLVKYRFGSTYYIQYLMT